MKNKFEYFNKNILKWYKKNKRTFTWRESSDPWKILLIEFLSQQTQLERADKYYHFFIEKYPTPELMAKKKKRTILKDWSGLGYNNRAIRLHDASKLISRNGWEEYRNDFSKLPGVGEYTKSALESFSYKKNVIALDTNVSRVLERYHGRSVDSKWIKENTASLLRSSTSRDWNQAVMDLSSNICSKRNPTCTLCPIENGCAKYFSIEKSKKKESFKDSNRERRGKILKTLINSKELTFSDVQNLIALNQQETLLILETMQKNELISINKEKKIVILTRK